MPDDKDVAFYREHGYYISPKLFSDDEIQEALWGIDRFYSGEHDFQLMSELTPFLGWTPKDGDGMRLNDYVSLCNRQAAALVQDSRVGAIAAKLTGSHEIRLWHDQLVYKPGNRGQHEDVIGWHTDHSYWQSCTSSEMITAWIPLQDTSEEMGTLIVIDGSHTWQNTMLRGFHEKAHNEPEEHRPRNARPSARVPMTLKKGQVSFHHCRTVHGSGPNRSGRPRISFSVHLQDASNRYRESGNDGALTWHRNHTLCRKVAGLPDYSDPDICPVLWSNGGVTRDGPIG